ncbi:MAG: hypothetical protein BWY75_03370 [bacterium ADurb.Bin425]|nr:MAG: hypothetical protein BWY75_03370 [bacterium ADurb.Bin425]
MNDIFITINCFFITTLQVHNHSTLMLRFPKIGLETESFVQFVQSFFVLLLLSQSHSFFIILLGVALFDRRGRCKQILQQRLFFFTLFLV